MKELQMQKSIILILVSIFLSVSTFAKSIFDTAPEAQFESLDQVAVPGRCFYSDNVKNKTAATLLVYQAGEQTLLAPLSVEDAKISYFDHLSYRDILVKHPEIFPQLFQPMSQGVGVKFIEKLEGDNHYLAELRENEEYYLLKAYRNGKVFRYCYYVKRELK